MADELHPAEVYLERISRDIKTMLGLVSQAVNAMVEAESEIPEKLRRFMDYMHNIHDVKFMYEELGHPAPQHLKHELERCDDRYRQLLDVLHTDGGAFEKVRREMADDPLNRWDHTRLLDKPKEDGK